MNTTRISVPEDVVKQALAALSTVVEQRDGKEVPAEAYFACCTALGRLQVYVDGFRREVE